MTDAERVARERAFHDERFSDDGARASTARFYRAVQAATADYEATVQRIAGRRVLEYGCGTGSQAFELSRRLDVVAIDISPVALDRARAEAERRGVHPSFVEMDAERLEFADRSFDTICGSGILHHLDLASAMEQIARVLGPGGRAVFMEPLGHNPLINAYRRRTPGMRSEDEHPLRRRDLLLMGASARSMRVRCHGLATLATAPFVDRPVGEVARAGAEALDRVLLRVPGVRLLAWIAVVELEF